MLSQELERDLKKNQRKLTDKHREHPETSALGWRGGEPGGGLQL